MDYELEKINMFFDSEFKRCRKKKIRSLWEEYYKFKSTILPSIDYSYALTVHKSQGSEWDKVFVDIQNIKLNSKISERNKLIYVGCSRAREKMILLV